MDESGCLEYDDLEAYCEGTLAAPAGEKVTTHLESCADCRARLEEVTGNLRLAHSILETRAAEAGALQWVGPFRIQRELGSGGMGVVYLAEQQQPRRLVALKLLRRSIASEVARRRFELEAEILARLEHPGIAQVFDAGISEQGEPYFTMEYVRGTRLDAFVEEQRLDTSGKLILLAKIADAVHHAHVHGVVHRDLKPGNILVRPPDPADLTTSEFDRVGAPKILDFGIARLVETDPAAHEGMAPGTMGTETGQLVGTIPYMSPEQVSGVSKRIDARSDVYALGVIGFQLLTGKLPHRIEGRSWIEAAQMVQNEDPAKLGHLDRRLRGDLETIFAKALHGDPARRYQSASEFAADLRRFLADEPIVARASSTAYQVQKLVARHQAPFALGAALFVALVAFGITMGILYARAQRAEKQAQQQARTATRVSEFLAQVFGSADPNQAPGKEPTAREILDRGTAEIRQQLVDEPEIRATLLLTIGDVYLNLGHYPEARRQYEEALAIRRDLLGESQDVAVAMNHLGSIHHYLGNYAAADSAFREAIEMMERTGGIDQLEFAQAEENLAGVLRELGRYPEAKEAARRSLDLRRELLGEEHLETGSGMFTLATIHNALGEYDSADALRERVIELRRKVHGRDHAGVADAVSMHGENLLGRGRDGEAEPYLREALEIYRRVYTQEHDNIARAAYDLARSLHRQGKYEEAEPLFREAIDLRRRLLGADHPMIAPMLSGLGGLQEARGNYAAAESLYRQGLSIAEKGFGRGHPSTAGYLNNLGLLLIEIGRPAEGETYLLRTLEILRETFGETHANTAKTINNLARAKSALGRHEEAQELYAKALAIRVELFGEDHPETATSLHHRADDAALQGLWSAAEQDSRRAWEIRRQHLGEAHRSTVESAALLGKILVRLQRFEEAEPLLLDSYVRLRGVLGERDKRTVETRRQIAYLYETWGKPEQAARYAVASP